MATFYQELRLAWRSLLQRRAYFLACAGTLALVLGANAAIFAVVSATMLRPMPFATTGEVVHLFSQPPGTTGALQRNPLQQMEVPRIRERARTLARLEGYLLSERVISLHHEPMVAPAASVTPGLLPMMAAPIAQGRTFLDSEGQPGQFVAIVSDRFWRDTLGADRVLGSALMIDGQPHTIIGVLAPTFAVPFMEAHVFTPLHANPEPQPRGPPRSVQAVAELARGATIEQVRAELDSINRQLAQDFPRTHTGWLLGVELARDWQYGSMRAPLLMLLAATGFVLLIACVNIANLTYAQAVARSGELALRLALGARAGDVMRGHLAELLIVGVSGLIPGLLLAAAAVPALLSINPMVARALGGVTIDWRVQLFSAGVAMLAAIGASAVPAMRVMHGQMSAAATAIGSRSTSSPRAVRLQRLLVSVEVALSVALLMAGAVIAQGLRELSQHSPGFQAAGVLTAQIRLPEPSYQAPEARAAVVERALAAIRALPGVVGASTTQNTFVPGFSFQTLITVPDQPTPDRQPHTVQFRRVSTDYFKTMQIPVSLGRDFAADDVAGRPHVAIVSRQFAERLLPGGNPIGRVLRRESTNALPLTVVGIVDDVSDVSVTAAPEPTLYVSWAQNNNSNTPVAFVIRTAVASSSVAPLVRNVMTEIDGTLPLRRVQPLEAFVADSMAPERFRAMLLAIIVLLGLVLAAVGIAGVTYRSVIDRTKEFAVRLALGSQPGAVMRLVLLEAARDLTRGALAGVAGGVALCAMLAQSMEHVGRVDAVTSGVAIVVMASVGVAAACLPALRVLRVLPAQVLRS